MKGVDLTGISFEWSMATVRLIWLPQDMSHYLHTLNSALLNNTWECVTSLWFKHATGPQSGRVTQTATNTNKKNLTYLNQCNWSHIFSAAHCSYMRGIHNNEDPFAVGVLKFELVTKDACACLLRPGMWKRSQEWKRKCRLHIIWVVATFGILTCHWRKSPDVSNTMNDQFQGPGLCMMTHNAFQVKMSEKCQYCDLAEYKQLKGQYILMIKYVLTMTPTQSPLSWFISLD